MAQLVAKSKEGAYAERLRSDDWLRGVDLNHRPLGYEPNELPDCSTPQLDNSSHRLRGSNSVESMLMNSHSVRESVASMTLW
jgi:hypothetical protein